MPPRGRAGFFCQSGALGSAILEKVSGRGPRASRPSSAPATAPTSPATTSCSTGRRTTPPRWCCSTSSRSVTRASSPASPAGSRRRKPIIAVRSGRTTQGVPMGHAVRQIAAPPQARRRDVPPGRGHPGRHPGRDVRRRPAAGPPAAAARSPGRHRRQLRRARPARRRRRRQRSGSWSASGRARRRRRRAEDFEDALDAAIDDPEVDAVVAVYIPPLDAAGEEVANVLAAVGEQSDKPLVSTFLGAEGVPELLRVPDLAGHTAGRGSVPSYPAVEAAVRALARVVEYAVWLRTPGATSSSTPDDVDRAGAKRHGQRAADAAAPTAATSTDDELRAAAGGLRHRRCGSGCRSPPLDEAVAAGERLGWDVVLKATAERLRQRPTSPTCGATSTTTRRCATPGRRSHGARSPTRRTPTSSCSAPRRPGVPVAIRSMEDPLFGPVVSFGVSGAADRAARRPRLPDPADRASSTPPRWSARSRRRRCCSATAAASRSTSPRSRTCIRQVAQLKNDLPQVSELDLLAGARRRSTASPCSRALGRVEPVARPPLGLVRTPADRRRRATRCPTEPDRPRAALTGMRDRLRPCVQLTSTRPPRRPRVGDRQDRLLPGGRGRRVSARRGRRGRGVVPGAPRADDRPRRGPPAHHVVVLTPTPADPVPTPTSTPRDDLLPEPYTSTSTEAIRCRRCARSWSTGWSPTRTSRAPTPAGQRGRAHRRLGRGQPDRPRARRLRRPRLRRRPRLHRRGRLRRLLAAGQLRRRRPGRRRRPPGLRRGALRAHRDAGDRRRAPATAFVEPATATARSATSCPRSPLRSGVGAGLPRRRRPGWCCRRPGVRRVARRRARSRAAAAPRRTAPYLASLLEAGRPPPPACRRPPPPA